MLLSIIVRYDLIATILAVTVASSSSSVDFSKIVNWEKRTLTCFGNDIQNRANYGQICKLSIADSLEFVETACYDEEYTEQLFGVKRKINRRVLSDIHIRTVCNIHCKGADRDSVVSKIPNSIHECVRWHNYNTLKKDDEWYMWRSGRCRDVTVAFEVYCGFPTNNSDGFNILTQNNISLSTKINF